MEVKPSYLGTMIALATVAFGLLAAGRMEQVHRDLIAIFLKPGKRRAGRTGLRGDRHDHRDLVVQALGKLAERESGLPRGCRQDAALACRSRRCLLRRFAGANFERQLGPVLHRRIDVRAHLEAFFLQAEPIGGLLDAVQDLGVEVSRRRRPGPSGCEPCFLRKQRSANFAGLARRFVLFVVGVVKDDDVAIFVDDSLSPTSFSQGLASFGQSRSAAQDVAGRNASFALRSCSSWPTHAFPRLLRGRLRLLIA